MCEDAARLERELCQAKLAASLAASELCASAELLETQRKEETALRSEGELRESKGAVIVAELSSEVARLEREMKQVMAASSELSGEAARLDEALRVSKAAASERAAAMEALAVEKKDAEVCVCVRERVCVCLCVRKRERERKRESHTLTIRCWPRPRRTRSKSRLRSLVNPKP